MSTFRAFQPTFKTVGWPFLFATLFGTAQDGTLTTAGSGAGNQADVGYLGAFGPKQYDKLTLSAGDTWTIAQGSSSGALMIACRNTLTIAGSIIANGANGSVGVANGSTGTGGAGGATAGGGSAGGTNNAANSSANLGLIPTKIGHGAADLKRATSAGKGGNSGAHSLNITTSVHGGTPTGPLVGATASGIIDQNGIAVGFVSGDSTAGTTTGTPTLPNNSDGAGALNLNGLMNFAFLCSGISGVGGGAQCSTTSGQEASGGGGGGGGGVIYLEADTINLVSGYSIQAKGGDGGNAAHSGASCFASGGSPGGGGRVVLVCRRLIGSTAAISVAGGTTGTGNGTSTFSGWASPSGVMQVIQL